MLWLELLVESGIVKKSKLALLHQGTEELLKITVSSIKTTKIRRASKGKPR